MLEFVTEPIIFYMPKQLKIKTALSFKGNYFQI